MILRTVERLGRSALRTQGVLSSFVSTDAGRVHILDARGTGSLPTVVFLHGIAASAVPFAPVFMPLLKHVRRVVVIDLPGHGFSDEVVGHLSPERLSVLTDQVIGSVVHDRVVLVGNSLGGALALHQGHTRPSRTRGLFLLSPAGAQVPLENWAALKARFENRTRAQALDFLQNLYHRTPGFVPFIAHEVAQSFQRKAVRDILSITDPPVIVAPEDLARLTMPIALYWGESERLIQGLEFFQESLPKHATIERPAGWGHCPQLDDPRGVTKRLLTFLRALPA